MLARNISVATTTTQGADRRRPAGLRWPFMRRLCKPPGIVSVPPSLLRAAPALWLGAVGLRVGAAAALIVAAVAPVADRLAEDGAAGWNRARFVRTCALSASGSLRRWVPCGTLSAPFSRDPPAISVPGASEQLQLPVTHCGSCRDESRGGRRRGARARRRARRR